MKSQGDCHGLTDPIIVWCVRYVAAMRDPAVPSEARGSSRGPQTMPGRQPGAPKEDVMKHLGVLLFVSCLILASCADSSSPTSPPLPQTRRVALTIVASPSDGGRVTISPSQTDYAPDTVVTLTATANPGYSFNGWSGDRRISHGQYPYVSWNNPYNPCSITMSSSKTITAHFKAN
jgi:hypothetical protein